ncbi:MAG: biopolymer transporter ExbD, partial [Verrucomicrobia bacterium]|nr:biopolymer transporter ExbD [Verrucomicrobiota bacterium]
MKLHSPLPEKKTRLEIIPLIDVMFFLLAAFMLVSLSMQKMQTKKMQLATAVSSGEDFKADIFNIGVDTAGAISVSAAKFPACPDRPSRSTS